MIVSDEIIFINPASRFKLICLSKFSLKENLNSFKLIGLSEEKIVVSKELNEVGGKLIFKPGFQNPSMKDILYLTEIYFLLFHFYL